MNDNFEKTAVRVSLTSIIWNTVLSVIKFISGIVSGSGAMISDAVHSASDVISSFIVMIGVKISARESDSEHPYGHERLECVAAIVLATILAVTGVGIGLKAAESLTDGSYRLISPGISALIAAVISIVTKESMYWYTRHYAVKINSGALMADAWHHRSDALSSVGALIGIAGARIGYHILEPAASLIICILILKAALDIFKDAVDKMIDKSCDPETENEIRLCASEIEGVKRIDLLRTRMFGSRIYVDMEIAADGNIKLSESHAIAEKVHDAIEQKCTKVKHRMVHVNPYE